jgi:hypothetical protein
MSPNVHNEILLLTNASSISYTVIVRLLKHYIKKCFNIELYLGGDDDLDFEHHLRRVFEQQLTSVGAETRSRIRPTHA